MAKRTRGKEIKGKKTKDEPRCIIYLYTEGTTERIYLEHFANRSYNVEIVPVDPDSHTDAYGIVKFAKQHIDNVGLDLKLGDRGYCVFDSDPKSNTKIKETFDLLFGYKEKGLSFVFSNPSFEVWFALHFGDVPHNLSAEKMKKHVKKHIKEKYPRYSETTDIYDFLADKQCEALKRSKILHKAQKNAYDTVYSHECNPYTNIFEFIDYVNEIKEKYRK